MGDASSKKEHMKLIKEFHNRYKARIVAALPKYGEFDPSTDKRNMGSESIEEVLDIGSYLHFGEQIHPDLEPQIQKIRAHTILLYGQLKRLEEAMRTKEKER